MVASTSSLLSSAAAPHLHIAGEHCPWCEQPIPHEKFAEIRSRIETRERDRFAELTRGLKEQVARDKTLAEAKAKADVEQARREGAAALETLKAQGAAREAAVREEERKGAAAALQAKLAEAERVRKASESALQAKVGEADRAKTLAEQAGAGLKAQIEQLRRNAAAREAAIRADATKAAETAMQAKFAEADRAKTAVVAELSGKLAEAQRAKETVEQHAAAAKEAQEKVLNERLQEVREALEKDKTAAVLAAEARAFEERQKWQAKVQELQRQVDNRKADELGEGAELELHEVLKAAFEDDRIRRVQKGTAGADIIHEVVHNGKVCGKIVYDSKNRNAWQSEFVAKLRKDQLAEGAEHAILSSNKFPKGASQLHIQDNVIIACPARVLALAELLRSHIVQNHELRVSNQEREEKTAQLYAYITSEQCAQLLKSVEILVAKLEQIEVDEQTAHKNIWKRRGELLRSVLKVSGDFRFALDRIIGTAEDPESA